VDRSDETTDLPDPRATIEAYDALAPICDRIGGWRWFGLKVIERLEPLIANRGLERSPQNGPPFTMLDLGCGSGALLKAMHVAHPTWRLAGADASPAMLREAARATAGAALLTRAMMPARLPFQAAFDVVGAFHDTLNHLPDDAALAATFHAVAAVLRPRGLFIFELTNEHGFDAWWRKRSVDLAGDDFRYECDFAYDPVTRLATAAIALSRAGTRRLYTLNQRCFSDPVVEIALRAAGFRLEIAAPWSPLKKDDPGKTWYVAQIDTFLAEPR
jgi:SAM-dependent methyltransferase